MHRDVPEHPAAVPARGWFLPEARALLRLGLPMVGTQFFIMAMGFLDTAIPGHYRAEDMAGVALGGLLLWPVMMLIMGWTMALSPIVSQNAGGGRSTKSGHSIRQCCWIALGSAALAMPLLANADALFTLAGVEPLVGAIAADYLRAVVWGLPPLCLYVTLRYAAEGLGHTRPPMLIAFVALVVNGILNWALVYGELGLPELGGVGTGWATMLVFWLELALMLLFVVPRPWYRATGFSDRFAWPDLAEIARVLRIGLPIGATAFLEMAVYSVIGFLAARIGTEAVAAHSIAGNLNWMTYVIPMTLGSAAGIRVGFHVGARDHAGSRRSALAALYVSLAYAVVVSLLIVLARHLLVAVYTDDAAVLDIAATLLLFIAVYQLADDTQATMAGALRGYKDTRVPMLISLVGYWALAMPLGVVLGFGLGGAPDLGVYGLWLGMTVGLVIVASMMGARLWLVARDDQLISRLAMT